MVAMTSFWFLNREADTQLSSDTDLEDPDVKNAKLGKGKVRLACKILYQHKTSIIKWIWSPTTLHLCTHNVHLHGIPVCCRVEGRGRKPLERRGRVVERRVLALAG